MKLKLYTSTILIIALSTLGAVGEPLVKNGNFTKKGIKPWKLFATKPYTKPEFKVADGVLSITSLKVYPKLSNEQLSQKLEGLKSDTKYRLTFEAKAVDTKNQLLVTLSRSKDWKKGHYGLFKKMTLTKEWQKHSMTFKTKTLEEGNAPQLKFMFGKVEGQLSFKNVKLKEVKQQPKKDPKEESKKQIEIKIK